MKFSIKILLIFIFCGCSNLSPNEHQINKTLSNLDCYKKLVKQIVSDDQLREKIIRIRESKKRGESDPITVKQDFRLIELDELANSLGTNWIAECKEKLEEENDFRGIRVIDKKIIIIEVDKFDRQTLTEQYSRGRTVETHRLIIAEKEFDRSNFYYGTERQIKKDTIDGHWIYEITQLK